MEESKNKMEQKDSGQDGRFRAVIIEDNPDYQALLARFVDSAEIRKLGENND